MTLRSPDGNFTVVCRRATRSRDAQGRPCLPFSTLVFILRAGDAQVATCVMRVRGFTWSPLVEPRLPPRHPAAAWFRKACQTLLDGRPGALAGYRRARRGPSSAALWFFREERFLDDFGTPCTSYTPDHRFAHPPRSAR